MGRQEAEFLRNEADEWFERNKHKPYIDHIGHAIRNGGIDLSHADILEVGFGRGDLIGHLQTKTTGICIGIDPSPLAVDYAHARYPDVGFLKGTARTLTYDGPHDLIIYSFCLYLCDRDDLFEIVACGDNNLEDKGSIVIHDFDPEHPYKTPYHHFPGLFSYKQDYSKLWLANPTYSLVNKTLVGDGTAVWVLKKDIEAGWPLEQTP